MFPAYRRLLVPSGLLIALTACGGAGPGPSIRSSTSPTTGGSSTSTPAGTGTPTGTISTTPTTTPPCGMQTGPLTLALQQEHAVPGYAWRVSTGRFLDTNGDGLVDIQDSQQIWAHTEHGHVFIDPTGQVAAPVLPDDWRSSGQVIDLDPLTGGSEYWTVSYLLGGGARISRFDQAGLLTQTAVPQVEGQGNAWFADLDGDGVVEVITSTAIRSAHDGALVAQLDGIAATDDAARPITADLDLDGAHEILAFHHELGARFYAPNGQVLATCWPPTADWSVASAAVGQFDGDPGGEVVFAGEEFVALCDSDGTLLDSVVTTADQPPMVGLAELDGDAAPEVIVGDPSALLVYDDDLTFMWSVGPGAFWSMNGFSVADLDGDGYHEILLVDGDPAELVILAGDGTLRASIPVPGVGSWEAQPLVTDLDGDGLAEIVLPTMYGVQVFDNGAGGWAVPESELPWSGLDRFPGSRDATGALTAGGQPHWANLNTNVWQGLPTVQHPADCLRSLP